MNDYSIKDHIAYSMGFKDGKESQAATIAGLQAAVIQCRSLTKLLKSQADRIAELEEALKPFAKAADMLTQDGWDQHDWADSSIEGSLAHITGADCRKARTALEGKKQ